MEKINDWQECYKDAIKEAVEYLHKIIAMANTAYYEGDGTMELLSDAQYDEYCKQYVELNKMLGKDIELRACSFFRIENVVIPLTTGTLENTISTTGNNSKRASVIQYKDFLLQFPDDAERNIDIVKLEL